MPTVTRRKALQLLASLSAVSLLPPARWAAAGVLPPELARFEESLEARAAAGLGRDYLASRPEEADADWLREAITGGGTPTPELVSTAVREDFATGRVAELRDWQVSLTEARIFALLALS